MAQTPMTPQAPADPTAAAPPTKKPLVPGQANTTPIPDTLPLAAAPAAPALPATPTAPTAPATNPLPAALPLAPAATPAAPNMALPDNQRGAIPTSMLAAPGSSNDEMMAKFKALNPGAFDAAGKAINDPVGTTHTIGAGGDQMQRPGGPITAGPVTGITLAQYAAAHPDPSQAVHDASNKWYADNGIANPDLPAGAPSPAVPASPALSLAPSPAAGLAPGAPANDVGGSAPGALPLAGIASPAAGPGAGVGLSDQDLTASTITPGAGLDRVGLARSLIAENRANSEPAWKATQRELTQNAAARGQTGSGMFRTTLGDAARAHENDLAHADTGFLSDALHGSVDDAYRNIGIAQQQQGFQAGQQRDAFSQALAQAQAEEAFKNGDFQRGMAILQAGNAGNPSDTALTLAKSYGDQAGAAGSSAAALLSGGAQANRADPYGDYLRRLYGGGDPTLPNLPDVSGMIPDLPLAGVYGDG